MKKIKKLLISLFFVITFTGCKSNDEIIFYEENTQIPESVNIADQEPEESPTPSDIYISIVGCVERPGVYVMPEGTRIYEVINEAGGVTSEGTTDSLNLVSIVNDSSTIYVPKISESDPAPVASLPPEEVNEDGKVNINTASVAKLLSLSGIGEAKAKAIISYREAHGNFSSIEDIKNVSGIKDGTFEAIKDDICVN